MDSNNLNKLERLKKDVEYDIQQNLGYLQATKADTSLYLSLIGFLATLGISVFYELLRYWVLSTYLLFILWFASSLFIRKNTKKDTKNIKDKINNEKIQNRLKTIFDMVIVNVTPMIKAVSVLFLVNIPIMLLAYGGLVKSLDFSFIITLSSLFPIIALKGSKNLRELFSKGMESLKKTDEKDIKELRIISNLFWVGVSLLLCALFIYSFYEAFLLVIDLGYDIPRLAIVSTLIVISFGFLSEYFSYSNVREELTNQNRVLNMIRTEIIYLTDKEDIDKETINNLKNAYLTAKLRIPAVSHILYFFNFHVIIYNPFLTDKLIPKDTIQKHIANEDVEESLG